MTGSSFHRFGIRREECKYETSEATVLFQPFFYYSIPSLSISFFIDRFISSVELIEKANVKK